MEGNKKMGKFDVDIEIKDLLWEFIRRWRIIVALAVICGVALTAYQYRIDMSKTDVVTVKKTQEELESTMGTQDLDEVTAAVALRRQADEKSAYMEASQLMKINPYEENSVLLQYYVGADSETLSLDANDAYIAYVNQGALAKTIADGGDYELEQVYLAELISIVKEESGAYINTKSASDRMALTVESGAEERVFTVKVMGVSKDAAEVLAADVKAALLEYNRVVTSSIGVHQLQLMSEDSVVLADQSLAELQNWNATSIKTISNNLDSMKNEMTGDQITLYTYRTTVLAETSGAAPTVSTVEKTVSISIKHLVIGVVVGIVLACGLIFVLYLFAATLRSSEEVKTLYGVKVLGCVDDTAFQKKKLFGFIDSIILKLKNLRRKKLTFEQEVEMICTNILLSCEKDGATEVFLATSALESIPEKVIMAVVEKCKQKNIKIIIGADIAYHAKNLELVANIGNIVFIEKKHVSLYDELYKEIALCKENEINVIGVVVVGV